MAAYYVIGALFVVWALVLTAVGLTREGFPPTVRAGRVIIGVSAVFFLATVGILLGVTEKEHPREEANAKALESAGEAKLAGATIKADEKEYSIKLSKSTLGAGPVAFDAANVGKIPHDLAISGPNVQQKKTPLIQPGNDAKLAINLSPGKYTLVCTVPGHEQLGMKTSVTVR